MSIDRPGHFFTEEKPKQEPEPEIEAGPVTERSADLWMVGYDQLGYAWVADDGKDTQIPNGAETWNLNGETLIYDQSRVEFHEEHNLFERVGGIEADVKLLSEGWDHLGSEEHMPHEVTEVYVRTKE